jgi:hypothetical protein
MGAVQNDDRDRPVAVAEGAHLRPLPFLQEHPAKLACHNHH